MLSKCSQKVERAVVERMSERDGTTLNVSESWHCILMHMVCWFTEPDVLMKSPSTGSLQCLLFYKNNAGCVHWLEDQSGPTNCCLP